MKSSIYQMIAGAILISGSMTSCATNQRASDVSRASPRGGEPRAGEMGQCQLLCGGKKQYSEPSSEFDCLQGEGNPSRGGGNRLAQFAIQQGMRGMCEQWMAKFVSDQNNNGGNDDNQGEERGACRYACNGGEGPVKERHRLTKSQCKASKNPPDCPRPVVTWDPGELPNNQPPEPHDALQ